MAGESNPIELFFTVDESDLVLAVLTTVSETYEVFLDGVFPLRRSLKFKS